jgi:hypothetical protein
MNKTVHKIRVSRRIQEFLEGTEIGQHVLGMGGDVSKENPASISMQEKIFGAKAIKDGSVTVELDFDEANSLYIYTDAMTAGAGDNASFEDSDARAELVSGRALLRKLVDLYGREVAR